MADTLPPIVRPNGKTYQPRKLTVEPIERPDGDYAVIVFGTHDVETAQPLADERVRADVDPSYVAGEPHLGWWRDGYQHGERAWVWDDELGRAGIRFTATERTDTDA